MGVKIRQKDGKWYVFINHKGKRKAKCVGDSKRAAEEVKRKLEAKLTLGDVGVLDAAPRSVAFADHAEQWLPTMLLSLASPPPGGSSGVSCATISCPRSAPRISEASRDHRSRRLWPRTISATRQITSEALVRTLHTICAQAVDEELIDRNPAAQLGRYVPEQRV